MRARYYAPSTGRFLTKDTWTGLSTSPISYNKWIYTNDNPVYYTDASGNFPLPLLLLLLGLGVITFGTSGCSISIGPEPYICPPLPENLQPDALRENPREQSLANIQNYFGIQLPPPVTYVDQNGNSHSTSYRYVHSTFDDGQGHAGYTPWFPDNDKLGTWGDVVIFELAFKVVGNNAYDIADVMVHEAMHAWQQYTLVQLAQDPTSSFSQHVENQVYYTKEWQATHNMVMEYEASSYVLQHTPKPLCTRDYMHNNEQDYHNANRDFTPVPGIPISPWPMAGYPLQ